MFRARSEERGIHCWIRVFVGPDEHHLALAGELCMRVDEGREFLARICGCNVAASHESLNCTVDTE